MPNVFSRRARAPLARSVSRKSRNRTAARPWKLSKYRLLEVLEARTMMHADPVQDAEHLAVFGARNATTGVITGGLVPDTALEYVSVPSSTPLPWSSPSSWRYVGAAPSDGSTPSPIPSAGSDVLIALGTTVIVDAQFPAALHTIRTDGTLRFDPHKNTSLLVDTILVEPEGKFQMGTDPALADPLSPTGKGERIDADKRAKVIFADTGTIDVSWDPLQFSRGLVSHGGVSIFGTTVTSFEQLDVQANVKDKRLILDEAPVGWKAGDRLVLTGDTAANSKNQNRDEEVQIVSVGATADNHYVVTITDPKVANWAGLKFAHPVVSGYVTNVSRNATFESQNVSTVARRGHIMFMHSDDVHVDGAGFYGLGRTDKRNSIDDPVVSTDPSNPAQTTTDVIDRVTNQRVMVPVVDATGKQVVIDGVPQLEVAKTGLNPRGRYAVHFHRAGTDHDGTAATIVDSSVVDSPGWGIVNHSSNVDIVGNVVFNALGSAFVTEAGDEVGTFDGNIAVHAQGSGAGIESRQQFQDFGHQGNGFWLQGGNVSVTNNIVSGQRGAAYVFFPRGLVQKGLGTTAIETHDLANPAWAGGKETIDVGSVPLREFKGNIAFASADGFESWFTLLDVSGKFADQRNLIEDFTTFGNSSGRAIFTPYTNYTTLKDIHAVGNVNSPGGTAFGRNDVTRNIVYDHVFAEGFDVGIDVPVNGANTIEGGYFNNIRSILITTANSRSRVVNINGNKDAAGNLDPAQVQFGTLTATALKGKTQYDVDLQSNFNPKENDITRLFNPDVIQMGTVNYNNKQLYYKEQAAGFEPFDTASTSGVAAFVPLALRDLTNQQMYDTYGLAIGGIVAPATATASDPRIDALIGDKGTYLPELQLLSKKYVNQDNGAYILQYRYYNPGDAKASKSGWVTVKETTATLLADGWNLVTRQVMGHNRTLLVYGDNVAPAFALNANSQTVINLADLHNGSTFVIEGNILDNSFGSKHFRQEISLNDPARVSAVQTDAAGQFVIITITVKDRAGNATNIRLRFSVSEIATLVKDVGRTNLPTILPSNTLQGLLGQA